MTSRAVTLFEHQFIPYDRLDETALNASKQAAARREQTLSEIERLNAAAGREILRLERKGLRAMSVVGVLRVGDLNLEILPKIDYPIDDLNGQPETAAAQNLLTMLAYAYDLPLIEKVLAGVGTHKSGWFDLLTRLFVTQLHREVLSGLPQGYLTTRDSLPTLRGRWDVQRQIQRSGQPRHTFEVVYDEYSVDIPLNQVFRCVLEQLDPLTGDAATRQMVSDLRKWFEPVTLLPQITSTLVEGITFNRLNERFRSAFNLARLFLAGEIIQLSHGSLQVAAFLVDMNVLFEKFVAAFIERHRAAILPPDWHNVTLRNQAKGMNLFLARAEARGVLRLRPDLLFLQPGQAVPLLVADTKYKILNPVPSSLSADPGDFYQMLAYAVRLKCPRGLLIYPQTSEHPPALRRFIIETTEYCVIIATIDLHTQLDLPGALIAEMRAMFDQVLSVS